MSIEKSVEEFMEALTGGRGTFDAWLEVNINNEADCKAVIKAAIAKASTPARPAGARGPSETTAPNLKELKARDCTLKEVQMALIKLIELHNKMEASIMRTSARDMTFGNIE